MRPNRMTLKHGMVAVAGSAVLFSWFGVTVLVATLIGAFLVSALLVKPAGLRGWSILLIAAFAALPWGWLASLYTFALRAALYLGHWPTYGKPDPKDLPARFAPQTFVLEVLIPGTTLVTFTSLLASFILQAGRPPRPLSSALVAAINLWAFSIILLILDPLGVIEWIMD